MTAGNSCEPWVSISDPKMSLWHRLLGVGRFPAEFGDPTTRSAFALAAKDLAVRASGHYAGVPGRSANRFIRRMRGSILIGVDRADRAAVDPTIPQRQLILQCTSRPITVPAAADPPVSPRTLAPATS